MKRKILLLSLMAVCVATLTVGTLAYFNAEDTAHNVINSGSVEIKVQEWADAEKQVPFENLEEILPGMVVTKIAEIKNTGESDAWIRVKVTKNIELTLEGIPDISVVELDLNTEDWTAREDGYLYCNEAVKPGEVTAPIFTTVTFKASMGNEYQNATAVVEVYAQAVQTANNGASALDAEGWPLANQQ